MLTTIAPLLSGKLRDLFCTSTSFVPEVMLRTEGRILVVDLPPLAFGPEGAAAQAVIKYIFGLALQRQRLDKKARPVAIFADEYMMLASRTDAELLSTARSSRICFVALIQDLPKLFAQLGKGGRDQAEAIIGSFGTRIYHANSCRTTNEHGAETVGRITKYNVSHSVSRGQNTGGSLTPHVDSGGAGSGSGRSHNQSESYSSYQELALPPEYFAKELRTGAKKNRLWVDAILVRNGARFTSTKAHWMKISYRQGRYE
jgi:hypothetical protein